MFEKWNKAANKSLKTSFRLPLWSPWSKTVFRTQAVGKFRKESKRSLPDAASPAYGDFHPRHLCPFRAALAPFDDRLDGMRRALDEGLDAAVEAVSHPSGDVELLGFLAHGLAVPHALNGAVNAQMPRDRGHDYRVES
jgi:hypothetical protein